ncbi:AhpC/TSA family protein [Daldinia bambusicola]|nr:AhpC/TSA family protein [Daldinia bambusicola]
MAFRLALRSAPRAFAAPSMSMSMAAAAAARPAAPVSSPARAFHATARAFIKVGEPIPDLEVLHEGSPGNKVNLAKEFETANGVIVGVPAAFSGACSEKHVPSYIKSPKLRDAGRVFVVSVNDAFVMKAWGDQLDPTHESGIRFLADPAGEFTKALDLGFDAPAIFGGMRAKRYALVVEDGKVKSLHVEPDNTGTNVSLAENVLG